MRVSPLHTHLDHMIEMTPTQWITKKPGVLQMSTNDDQSSG